MQMPRHNEQASILHTEVPTKLHLKQITFQGSTIKKIKKIV